jgi:hypothetical protein
MGFKPSHTMIDRCERNPGPSGHFQEVPWAVFPHRGEDLDVRQVELFCHLPNWFDRISDSHSFRLQGKQLIRVLLPDFIILIKKNEGELGLEYCRPYSSKVAIMP